VHCLCSSWDRRGDRGQRECLPVPTSPGVVVDSQSGQPCNGGHRVNSGVVCRIVLWRSCVLNLQLSALIARRRHTESRLPCHLRPRHRSHSPPPGNRRLTPRTPPSPIAVRPRFPTCRPSLQPRAFPPVRFALRFIAQHESAVKLPSSVAPWWSLASKGRSPPCAHTRSVLARSR
jgi:hypothetical protein